jgi:AcrR family transcriptional regulator
MPHREGATSSYSGRLSRALIIDTALAQIDQSGTDGLSMRSLAKDLGVEAMSLYRYVHGREDLLEGITDALIGDLSSRLDTELTEHWQGFLQALAHQVRQIAVDHPKAFPLVATRHPAAPWLRPPLRSIELVDTFLSALIGYGFTDAQAVAAYRSFTSFLIGQLLLESAVRGASTGPVDEPIDEGDADIPEGDGQTDLQEAPEVERLRPLLSEDRSEEEFEASLELLLDRLAGDLSS